MPPSHAKLTLDEQSFQDLLAAAYTIQEHNDRRRKTRTAQRHCGFCGGELTAAETRCARCGADPNGFRAGERLQRNWASLWMMSQHPELTTEATPINAGAGSETEPHGSNGSNGHGGVRIEHIQKPEPELDLVAELAKANSLRISEVPEELMGPSQTHGEVQIHSPEFLRHAEPEEQPTESENWEEADTEITFVSPGEIDLQDTPSTNVEPPFQEHGLAFWKRRLTVRFDRSDLYLVLATAVAAVAFLWVLTGSATPQPPTKVGQRAELTLWERTLIGLGIAEAPDAAVFRGDPNVKVWVDPHHALYYCQGEQQFGKTPDGRFETQREAQMDQFEPSERLVCE